MVSLGYCDRKNLVHLVAGRTRDRGVGRQPCPFRDLPRPCRELCSSHPGGPPCPEGRPRGGGQGAAPPRPGEGPRLADEPRDKRPSCGGTREFHITRRSSVEQNTALAAGGALIFATILRIRLRVRGLVGEAGVRIAPPFGALPQEGETFMRTASLYKLSAVVAVGALALAGCGSRGGSPSSGGGGNTAGGGTTVEIGVDAPLTGGLAALGLGIQNSADLAVKTANKNNEVPGVTFKLVAKDDQKSPRSEEHTSELQSHSFIS